MKVVELGTGLVQRLEVIEIPLAHGQSAFIDNADEGAVRPYRWFLRKSQAGYHYAYGRLPGTRRLVPLHRLLLDAGLNEFVDHKNGNGLDNRRENLRLCSQSQNCANARKKPGLSKFKGVCKDPGGWRAQIVQNYKKYNLGTFPTQEAAALAYDEAARRLFGEFARCNFPATTRPHPQGGAV